MNFLASIVGYLIKWLLEKLFAIVGRDIDLWREQREAKEKAEEDRKKIEEAKSDEDRAKAGRDSAHDTFG